MKDLHNIGVGILSGCLAAQFFPDATVGQYFALIAIYGLGMYQGGRPQKTP